MSFSLGLSSKQLLSFKESNAKLNIWEGAVRSGKTYISLWRFLTEVAEGPEGEYVVVCRTYDAFKRNILPQIVRMIGGSAKYYKGNRELNIFGKRIHIVGADDERAETKIRGSTFMGAYVDEATIIPETVWMMLKSRCAMKGAKIFATCNPDSPYHWLKKDCLEGNPDVKSWKFTLEDNPDLSREEKEYLKRQYRGLWYKRFIEGLWVQAEGAIFDFFDPALHCQDFVSHGATSYIVGIDYGTTNPCCFLLLGINFRNYPRIWVEDEYYFNSKTAQRQKTDEEYADDLLKFVHNKNVAAIYIDPSAASFKTEVLKKTFLNVIDAENEVVNGIRFVAQYLNQGTLKICKKAKNLISEMQSYVWDPKCLKQGIDKPLKENDHAIDALRYALYTHFFGKDDWGTENGAAPLTPRDLDRYWQEARGTSPSLPPFFQNNVF